FLPATSRPPLALTSSAASSAAPSIAWPHTAPAPDRVACTPSLISWACAEANARPATHAAEDATIRYISFISVSSTHGQARTPCWSARGLRGNALPAASACSVAQFPDSSPIDPDTRVNAPASTTSTSRTWRLCRDRVRVASDSILSYTAEYHCSCT